MVKRNFSLKKLLAVMTAICIVLAVVFNWWHDYRRTKSSMHALSVAGVGWRFRFEGELKEDGHSWNNQDRWFFDKVKTWEPVLYPEMFYDVEAMFFEPVPGRPLNTSDFQTLTKFKGLKYLQFERMDLDGSCIPYLASMKQLRILNLSTSNMTKEGIERLHRSLPNTKINSTW